MLSPTARPASRRVLVIDDSDEIHRDYQKVLRGSTLKNTRNALSKAEEALFGASSAPASVCEFDLDFAFQGKEGASLVKHSLDAHDPYGCIFVDMRMPPGWDGIRTAQEIWAIDPDAQIVVCSAYSDHSWEELTAALNRIDQLLVLKKPFDTIEVRQLAASMCAKRALLSERAQQVERLIRTERMAAMGRMAGGVAHDFNNILTAILNFSTFVHNDLEPTDPRRNDLNQVIDSAQRAGNLVKQLLLFSKRADHTLKKQNIDIIQLLLNMTPLIRSMLGESITFNLSLSEGPIMVNGEEAQLERLLMNLAINAAEAMDGDGALTIATEHTHDAITLTIRDTGCGMASETLAHIFEPFYTTKENGTGLGLATSHAIIERHGGAMEIKSTLDVGTTFSITLPRASEPALSTLATAVTPEPRHAPLHTHGTILIVDDQPIIRSLCARVLSRRGFTVHTAASGGEALEHLKTVHTDLLITDLMMPQMNGQELSALGLTLQPDLRILFISGYADDEIIDACDIHATRRGFLNKPFLPQKLIDAVAEVLEETTLPSD